MARGDVSAVVGTLRYYAGWADKIEGKTIDINHESFHYTRQEPVSFITIKMQYQDTNTS